MSSTPPQYDHARLRAWRDEAGLTKERVAADLMDLDVRITATWLNRLERGVRTPSLGTLTALAAYYGRDMAELWPSTTQVAS